MQDNNMELYAAEFLLFGLPLIGGAINIILTLAQIQSDKKWYEECPGRDRCGFDKCMRHSLCACCTNEADAKRREKGGCRGSLLHLPFKQSNHNGVTLRRPNLFWS